MKKKNILNLILKTFPRFLFSNFDKNKLGKPVDTTGKSALKSTQLICKIWKWLVLSQRRYSSAKLRKFMDVYMVVVVVAGRQEGGGGGQVFVPTKQTSVKFRGFEELYLLWLSTNHFQTWQFY